MISFFKLCEELKEESDPIRKKRFLTSYLSSCDPEEIDVALSYLSGKKEKAILTEAELISFARAYSNQPNWLIESSIREVGDFSEALALLTENSSQKEKITRTVLSIRKIADEIRSNTNRPELQKNIVDSFWDSAATSEKIFLHRILLGKQIVKIVDSILLFTIADCFDLEIAVLFEKTKIYGVPWKSFSFFKTLKEWFPHKELFRLSKTEIQSRIDSSLHKDWKKMDVVPFPEENSLLEHSYFLIPENGIEVQIVLDSFGTAVWSRENYIYQKEVSDALEDFFSRIDAADPVRKSAILSGWLIQNDSRNTFVFYDILSYNGEELLEQSISRRREFLNSFFCEEFRSVSILNWRLISASASDLSNQTSDANSFRKKILKNRSEAFIFNPQGNRFYSLKPALQSVKAVLLYGRKATSEEGFSFWELSFGLRKDKDDSSLVTIARTSVGSEDSLFAELDLFFKENTIEKKGPIRGVPTIWKTEILFRSRVASKRHKIGFVLQDVSIGERIDIEDEVDSLDILLKM